MFDVIDFPTNEHLCHPGCGNESILPIVIRQTVPYNMEGNGFFKDYFTLTRQIALEQETNRWIEDAVTGGVSLVISPVCIKQCSHWTWFTWGAIHLQPHTHNCYLILMRFSRCGGFNWNLNIRPDWSNNMAGGFRDLSFPASALPPWVE